MKKGLCLLLLTVSLASCTGNGTAVSVKTDSLGQELDTLGEKIEEKAEAAGDSVKAKYKEVRETIQAGLDSVKQARRDTTN